MLAQLCSSVVSMVTLFIVHKQKPGKDLLVASCLVERRTYQCVPVTEELASNFHRELKKLEAYTLTTTAWRVVCAKGLWAV